MYRVKGVPSGDAIGMPTCTNLCTLTPYSYYRVLWGSISSGSGMP